MDNKDFEKEYFGTFSTQNKEMFELWCCYYYLCEKHNLPSKEAGRLYLFIKQFAKDNSDLYLRDNVSRLSFKEWEAVVGQMPQDTYDSIYKFIFPAPKDKSEVIVKHGPGL